MHAGRPKQVRASARPLSGLVLSRSAVKEVQPVAGTQNGISLVSLAMTPDAMGGRLTGMEA